MEHAQVHEIHVSAVKDDDLAGFDSRADLRGTNAVGGLGRFDQDKARQQAVQVQPHMELGGGFAPAVLEPSRCKRQFRAIVLESTT